MKGAGQSGWLLYARVLRCTAYGGATAIEAAQALGVCLQTMRKLLRRLHALRLVHIAAWEPVGTHNMPVARFVLGDGEDARYVYRKRRGPTAKTGVAPLMKAIKPRPELTAFASIVRTLQAGPCTVAALAQFCGLNQSFLYKLVKTMHELRLLRIADWELRLYGGCPGRVYAFEVDGRDAPRPKPVQRQVIDARRRIRRYAGAVARNSSVFNLAA